MATRQRRLDRRGRTVTLFWTSAVRIPATIDVAPAFRPRMVVLDINMPGLDGFETAKRLKQQSWARMALFVAHTGMQREAAEGDVFADFDHVLTKGDGSEALKAIVDDLRASS